MHNNEIPVNQLNRAGLRAGAKKEKTEIVRCTQDSSDVKYKQIYVTQTRKSRAGVEYTIYKPLIVRK